jgi:predicted DCC family thiol-disulfide oxidoreductase YuxK
MKHILLWDGDCGFCARCAAWLQAQDRGQLFEIVPHQSKSEAFLAGYGLDHTFCNQEIKLITGDGKILGGAEALNFFLEKYFPWKGITRIIKRLPPLLVLEKLAYRTIAVNRPLLSKWLGAKACSRA